MLVRDTLQVMHTSGTVGTPLVQWGSEQWAINKVQDLNVGGPECPSWDLNVWDPNVEDLKVLAPTSQVFKSLTFVQSYYGLLTE